MANNDSLINLRELQKKVIAFRDERNWKQFHTLKNLLIALNIECAELQELFLWDKDEDIINNLDEPKRKKVAEEIGDIFIYLLYLSDYFKLNLIQAAFDKLEINRKKYPVSKSYNSSKKYDSL